MLPGMRRALHCAWGRRWLLALGLALAGAGAGAATPAIVDLHAWDFDRDGIALIDGSWEFVPGQLLAPGDPWPGNALRVQVPGEWNAGVGHRHGAGTYRVQVDCREATRPLALALTMQHASARYFVNGRLLAQQGSPAATREAYQPSSAQQVAPLPPGACPFTLQVQVANHDLFRGGVVRSIHLGTADALALRRAETLLKGQAALGALLFMGLFSLMFFLWRRRDPAPLFFGLFSISCAISLGLAGERPAVTGVEALGFHGLIGVLYFNWFFALGCFPWVLLRLYPAEGSRRLTQLFGALAIAGMALALVAPTRILTLSTPVLIATAVAEATYLIAVLALAMWRRKHGAAVLLLGTLAFAGATAHDVILFQHILSASLVPYGMLAFVLAPALLLARRFSQALSVEELRVIEQRGRSDMLVRATKAGLLDWDTVQNTVQHSERFKEMLGYEPDTADADIPGLKDLLHPDDREAVWGSFVRQLRLRSVRNGVQRHEPFDYRLRRRDGSYLWIHAEGIGLCGGDGRTLRFICSFIDISASKRHELEMSNRVKFINDLFDSVPLALAMRDVEGRYVFVNRTWERYFGLSRGSVLGSSLAGVDDPAAQAAVELDRQAIALGPQGRAPEHEVTYNGRHLVQTRTPMADSEGSIIGVLVTSLDVTEKHATAQALAMERERLRLLVRSTRAGFGDWDAVRNTVDYTGRFKEMLGYPPDFDTTKWPSIFEMMHPDDRERARAEFRAMIRRKPAAGEQVPGAAMSYRLRRRDGSYVWIHAEGISLVDEQGRTRRFITSYQDVTRFHEQEEALRASRDQIAAQAELLERQNEALKENVRLREEVERIGRHDLKTPLNSIVAVPRLLREERKLGPEADELLGIVERAGYRILSMVNLSTDLYKMEQGTYAFRPDAVDLAELVHKVITDMRTHAASKQVRLQTRSHGTPLAWAEELLCYSLIANLLKNAVEASPEGRTVTVEIVPAQDDRVALRIHNDGVVPAAIRGSFFQKYATLGKASGTGLGTYSARLMAQVQDGSIAMETSEEAGTTLTVTLKRAPAGTVPAALRHAAEPGGAEAQKVAALPPMRVLLVDDDEYNLLIVRRFLPSPPFEVDTAINGRVALAAVELQWPGLVLMDLDMPVMGGLEAVQKMREHQRTAVLPPCSIVALSSHDDEDTCKRALAAGFDRYLSKPVTRDAIHAMLLDLNTLIGEAASATPEQVPAPIRTRPAEAAPPSPVLVLDPDVEPVLQEFLASRRLLLDRLGDAMRRGERGEVRAISHQLAGSMALYGFGWASERSRWLEKNFSEVDEAQVRALAAQLREHLDTVEIRFAAGPDS